MQSHRLGIQGIAMDLLIGDQHEDSKFHLMELPFWVLMGWVQRWFLKGGTIASLQPEVLGVLFNHRSSQKPAVCPGFPEVF